MEQGAGNRAQRSPRIGKPDGIVAILDFNGPGTSLESR